MTKLLLVLALVANSLILVGERQPDKHTKIIYLLPANFHGWVCVEYGVRDSPPLPREGSALIVRPRPGQVLKTSDKPGEPPYFP